MKRIKQLISVLSVSAFVSATTIAAAILLHLTGPTLLEAASKSEYYNELSRLTRAKNWSGAETSARRARAAFPSEPGFMRYLTWALCSQRKFAECARQAAAGLKQWPGDRNLEGRLYRAHRDHGRDLMRRKDYAGAARALNKALALGARRSWIYKLLTNAYGKGGQTDKAVAAAAAGLKKYPTDKYLRVLLGRAYAAGVKAARKRGDASATARLLRESEAAMDHSLGLHANRHLFRVSAKTLVRERRLPDLRAFLKRMESNYGDDPYLHKQAAANLRSLYNRDKRKYKPLYDEAVAHRKRAYELYLKRNPDRESPANPEFPLRGAFMVINAYGTAYTHHGYNNYCYDFLHTGPGGRMLRPGTDGSRNEDWYGFGGEIRAVLDGKVRHVVNHYRDLPPGRSRPSENNTIEIDHGNGIFSVYLHNKRGSALVRRGQSVRKGQVIALAGNSGWTVSPHLHFCIYDKNRFSLPPRFPAARVRTSMDAPPVIRKAPFRKHWRVEWQP